MVLGLSVSRKDSLKYGEKNDSDMTTDRFLGGPKPSSDAVSSEKIAAIPFFGTNASYFVVDAMEQVLKSSLRNHSSLW